CLTGVFIRRFFFLFFTGAKTFGARFYFNTFLSFLVGGLIIPFFLVGIFPNIPWGWGVLIFMKNVFYMSFLTLHTFFFKNAYAFFL
ncbi:hypothetical protein ACQWKR_23630, partial [Salmonella enterica subsp. enterica serovar Infantis]